MTVVFHILSGGAIAHVAVAATGYCAEGRTVRPRLRTIAVVALLGVMSHGLLDGLKHGYPIPPVSSIALSILLGALWILVVRPPLAILFAVAIGSAVLPDVIDLGPDMARSHVGIDMQIGSREHVFPWHWRAGSGSMYPGDRDPARNLSVPRNQIVSYANHAIMIVLSLFGIAMSPSAFRGVEARVDLQSQQGATDVNP